MISRGAKGILMGVWLMAILINLMLLLFNLEAMGAGVHDDTFLLFLNGGAAVLCFFGYDNAKKMETKEDDDGS